MLLKDEVFSIIDVKSIKSKKGKMYYFVTLYSNLGYIIEAFSDEATYNYIRDDYKTLEDLDNYIDKRYDKTSQQFTYFFSMQNI